MCGEKRVLLAFICGIWGSPPHVRGKASWCRSSWSAARITPACAGKRVRGIPRTYNTRGSPPHVRGKVIKPGFRRAQTRITPACAGKRHCNGLAQFVDWDHPRMCGEKGFESGVSSIQRGSPPHVRGKGFFACPAIDKPGITPACAGKRLKRSRSIVPHAAIVPLFPSVCNKPAGSDGSPAGHDAPPFLPIENAVPASPAYNLRSL